MKIRLLAVLAIVCLAACAAGPQTMQEVRTYFPPPLPPPTAEQLAAAQNGVAARMHWVQRPTARDLLFAYPPEALDRAVDARVTMDCLIQSDGALACVVVEEAPAGYNFAEAARLLSTRFRVTTTDTLEQSTIGQRLRVPIVFILDEHTRGQWRNARPSPAVEAPLPPDAAPRPNKDPRPPAQPPQFIPPTAG
jgi:hypothetical protein